MGTMNDPKWWSAEHRTAWERVKDAFRRDWEQTKNDFSKTKGADLDQDVGDTVKQAVGKQPIPPADVPNADADWDRVEAGMRYGYGARQQYAKEYPAWDDRVEGRLSKEWDALGSGQRWDEIRTSVRRGWDRGPQQ